MPVGAPKICTIHFEDLREDGTCRKCTEAAHRQKKGQDRPHRKMKGIAGAPARPWKKRRF